MRNKTEEFIIKAKKKHGDRYTYDNTDYQKNNIKIKIICPIHGEFMQTPGHHLQGRGCPECAKKTRWDSRGRLTFQTFKERSVKIHDDRYEYTEMELDGNDTMVEIICPEHGKFEQRASSHLVGSGCPKCAGNTPKTTLDFISNASTVHNGFYDYSKTRYHNAYSKVIITCPIHGDFEQTPDNHINGKQGCILS